MALTSVITLVGVGPAAAFAQPVNDDFASATTISSLPFAATQDTSSATPDPSDPRGCHNNASVWFAFTPSTDMLIQASTAGSGYSTVLSAWTGTPGSLVRKACNYGYEGRQESESRTTFAATAGTTYYFMIVPWFEDEVGDLHLSINEVTAPENDNFADATVVGGIPFSPGERDLGGASMETGEPACAFIENSVWYSYTPTTTQSITARTSYWGGFAAYTGTSLASLIQIGCSGSVGVTFRAEAGATYLFQVAARQCCSRPGPESGLITFDLDVAPDPVADFYFEPRDPSAFDTINFRDYSFDPGRTGPMSALWDFGDGTTSTEHSPNHRYSTDGDYPVRLTVTTSDGRTALATRVVAVRTHDVAITRLAVPAAAHAGHTIKVSVHVQSTRLPETVRVDLGKSIPGGVSQIGSLTQPVPVQTDDDEITRFAFSYMVTDDDLTAGTITFRANASIVGARDAVPGDNTLPSMSVKVF